MIEHLHWNSESLCSTLLLSRTLVLLVPIGTTCLPFSVPITTVGKCDPLLDEMNDRVDSVGIDSLHRLLLDILSG